MPQTSEVHVLAELHACKLLVPNPKRWKALVRRPGEQLPAGGFHLTSSFDTEVQVPEGDVARAYEDGRKFCEVLWPHLFGFTSRLLAQAIGHTVSYGLPVTVDWQPGELSLVVDGISPASAPALPIRFTFVHPSRKADTGCFSHTKALVMLTRSGRMVTACCSSPKIDWGQSNETARAGFPPLAAFDHGGNRISLIDQLLKTLVLRG